MELHFKKPITPNFVRTEEGVFPIQNLSEEDLEKYIEHWTSRLREEYSRKKLLHKL